MADRILEFFRNHREDGPCLVLDLDVRDNMLLLPIIHGALKTDIDELPSAFAPTGGFHWNVR